MPGTGAILVLNAGSSSIKFALFDGALTRLLDGAASEIGGASALHVGNSHAHVRLDDHASALDAILGALDVRGWPIDKIAAAGHRVVHGGVALTGPAEVDESVIAAIRQAIPLAPLHNGHNLAAMTALEARSPGLRQFISVDTAFHSSIPPVATTYALPLEDREAGIRRYGFHGLSYTGLVRRLPSLTGAPLPRRLLAFHMGNGASITAIREGHSVATSMGYSPVSGMTMGTRVGEIDANAVLKLVDRHGVTKTATILNRESGLKALSGGVSDMRELLNNPSPETRFAVEHFTYWAVRQAASLAAAMGGLDAVVFTGGIGEHAAPVREAIMDGLAFLGIEADAKANAAHAQEISAPGSAVTAWIISADEERVIAEDALCLMQAG
ncbi:MAG: acetate/propionate family kinase [Brevirhabdus sp.]